MQSADYLSHVQPLANERNSEFQAIQKKQGESLEKELEHGQTTEGGGQDSTSCSPLLLRTPFLLPSHVHAAGVSAASPPPLLCDPLSAPPSPATSSNSPSSATSAYLVQTPRHARTASQSVDTPSPPSSSPLVSGSFGRLRMDFQRGQGNTTRHGLPATVMFSGTKTQAPNASCSFSPPTLHLYLSEVMLPIPSMVETREGGAPLCT